MQPGQDPKEAKDATKPGKHEQVKALHPEQQADGNKPEHGAAGQGTHKP